MSSNINITVFTSKIAQDAAERAELAAKKIENATDNLVDPTPPGTEANPAVIPDGPEGMKGKFEPQPGFYQGFPEVTADKRWYFYWDTSTWTLIETGIVPMQQGVDILDPTGEGLPTEKAVADYALEKKTLRVFPSNFEVYEIDRPDLDLGEVVSVDSEGYILSPEYYYDYTINKNYKFEDFDRPDLDGIVEVDKDYYLITGKMAGGTVPKPNECTLTSLFAKKFYEPSPISQFVSGSMWDYNALISEWDAIVAKANQFTNYVTKTELGRSSTKDLPIYQYNFLPENPKIKVIVNTGLHASEKIYIHLLKLFFDNLVDNWTKDPLLEWMRLHVNFIAIPCLSPSCMTGIAPQSSGGRRVHETDPVPISWTKNGTEATITFDVADFPSTGGRLTPASYFSNGNIAGKTWVSLFDSSQPTALPNNGYVIKSVVNGYTIVVDTGLAGTESGTGKMYVGVDINRNMQADGSNLWNSFTPTASSSTMYSNDYVPNPNDNKGTKPFSLSESLVLKSVFDNNPDALLYVDLHSGAGNNYLHWNTKEFEGQSIAIAEVKEHQSIFNSDGYSRVLKDAPSIPYSGAYAVNQLNIPSFTLEWEQQSTTDSKNATDAFRWLSTFLISFIRNLKK